MSYTQRIANADDQAKLASLWRLFAMERQLADPTMLVKTDYDFSRYVGYQLSRPLSFCFILESEREIVGFLAIYFYDESPPPQLAGELEIFESPFVPRRVGAVLGLYVDKKHQQPAPIKLLINAALMKAEELKVTDLDLLVSIEQSGLHALLKRYGFAESAVQYTRHFQVPGGNLPSLHPVSADLQQPGFSLNQAIPLRDPITNTIIRDLEGELVYLEPLKDESGKVLTTSRGLPVYPLPLRDPQNHKWVFDSMGKLVLCPVSRNSEGEIIENNGLPQFQMPEYEYINGQLCLKRDQSGDFCFT